MRDHERFREDVLQKITLVNGQDSSGQGHEMVTVYLLEENCDHVRPDLVPEFAGVLAADPTIAPYHPMHEAYATYHDDFYEMHVGGICLHSPVGEACEGCYRQELDDATLDASDNHSCQRGPDRMREMLANGLWFYASAEWKGGKDK